MRRVTGREAPAAAGPPSREAAIADFSSRVSVEPVRSSRLVDVSFVASDAGTASRAINALVEKYVEQNLAVRQQDMSKSLMWLSEELERQEQRVEGSERAMAEYPARGTTPAPCATARTSSRRGSISSTSPPREPARRARRRSRSTDRFESLGAATAAETIQVIASNPSVQSVKATLAELQRQKTLLAERYGDKHPEMVTVVASIQDATRQLNLELSKAVEAIRHDYESSVLEEKTLGQALVDQQSVAADLDRKGVAYTVMEREAQSNRQLYETLLQREKELQVLANSRGNNVRLIDRATIPSAPFAPDVRRSLMLGSLAGLLVAFGLVFALDSFDDTIKSAEDVTRKLGLPCLGMVPDVRPRSDRPVVSDTGSGDFGEAIRSLRTSVAFSSESEGSAVILVTSAQPLEGKTTTACNLAMAMAYGGAKVLLVDADLRRPSVHDGFGLENRVGISDVLAGDAPLAAAPPAGEPRQSVGDARRGSAAQPVGAARLEADGAPVRADAHGPVRVGDHRHAAGAGGHRRVDPRARGHGCGVRAGFRHDASPAGRACHRDAGDRRTEDSRRRPQPRRGVAGDLFVLGLPAARRTRHRRSVRDYFPKYSCSVTGSSQGPIPPKLNDA